MPRRVISLAKNNLMELVFEAINVYTEFLIKGLHQCSSLVSEAPWSCYDVGPRSDYNV